MSAKKISLAAFSLVLLMTSEKALAQIDVHYTLCVKDPAEGVVEVVASLQGAGDSVELDLPEQHSFVRLDAPRMKGDLQVRGESRDNVAWESLSPYRWRLDTKRAGKVEVRYVVPLDHRTLEGMGGVSAFESPYMDRDHAMLAMATLILAPRKHEIASMSVGFDVPEDWAIITPWPEVEAGRYVPSSYEALRTDFVALGHWDVHREQTAGMDLLTAFAPGQEALRQATVACLGKIVDKELELFGGRVQSQYLFLFGRADGPGYGGSPRIGSMTMFVSSELPIDFAMGGLRHLIAHEFHHTWARARCVLPDDLRFVGEGFTDWFAFVVLDRLKFEDAKPLSQVVEEKLLEWETQASSTSLSLVEAGGPPFFEGGAAYTIVYAGGLVLASLLDVALREEGETTLEVFMRTLMNDPRWRGGVQPTLEDFWALVEESAGEDVRVLLEELATSPGFPQVVHAFEDLGVDIERVEELEKGESVVRYVLGESTRFDQGGS